MMRIVLWLVMLVAAFLILAVAAMLNRRAVLRREFKAFLRERRPDLQVAAETSHALVLATPDGASAGTLSLYRLYREAPVDKADRPALYERLVGSLSDADALARLGPDSQGRLMPRIVNDRFLADIRREVGDDIPAIPFGVDGLSAVLVLDNENSVAYLNSAQLGAIGVDPRSGLPIAEANLARLFAADPVRAAVTAGKVSVIKSRDTYDAARLLLVPQHLGDGEQVAALIPDRDTLVLARVPPDGNWARLHELAKNAEREPLFTKALLVTAQGISIAPG